VVDVEPLTVVYEEFSNPSGYESTVRRVLEHLDLDHTIDVPGPRTMRQADHISDEWVDRFLREQSARGTSGVEETSPYRPTPFRCEPCPVPASGKFDRSDRNMLARYGVGSSRDAGYRQSG
jgi:hypothetical protein